MQKAAKDIKPLQLAAKGLSQEGAKGLMQMTAKAGGMADRDTESGQYTETYPLSEFVDALEELGGSAGTQEVADAVGCKYRTANAKLHELKGEGEITSQKVGNAYLWKLEEN